MRRRGKVDRNHTEIVEALRVCGWHVLSLADLGNGVPDLLIFKPGRTMQLAEIKTRTGRITRAQAQFMADWPVTIVRSVDEALAL